MKNQFYGDKRDLVKWSVLVRLAEKSRARTIIQIAYLTQSKYDAVSIGDREFTVPKEVLEHFRQIRSIRRLKFGQDARVICYDKPFSNTNAERARYHREVIDLIREHNREKPVILLDPDNGLEPVSRATNAHVLKDEVKDIWATMAPGTTLIVYQHQYRDKEWVRRSKEKLQDALQLAPKEIEIGRSDIARDVVFYIAVKK
jgi:hypothetical protein